MPKPTSAIPASPATTQSIETAVAKKVDDSSVLKLPNMNEFSPGTLGDNRVRRVLALLAPLQGSKEDMIQVLMANYPRINATADEEQRRGRANNVLIGMSQCGLLKKNGEDVEPRFTDFAAELHALPDDASANARFAKHLLENCHGLKLIDVVEMIRARGDDVTLQEIRDELRARGFVVTENEGNPSKIRKWLEASEIVGRRWEIDEAKLHSITGAASPTLAQWNGLTRPQRVFLEQARFQAPHYAPGAWISVRHLKKLGEGAYGRKVFPEGRLRDDVIAPLETDGWLEAKGTGKGRGGDSGEVRPLPQLTDLKIALPVDDVSGIPVDLRDKLALPLDQIFQDLKAKETGTKGLALELLALRFARDIGLFPVGFRERSAKTHGAEVDLIANGVNLHYSRWLIQCKNTKRVDVHDIAKEVGMAVVMKAHVVMMVSTGTFSRAVRTFAEGLANTSALQAVLIDADVLKKYKDTGGHAMIDWLRVKAYRVLQLKAAQVHEVEEE